MNYEDGIKPEFNLYDKIEDIATYYRFFDFITHKFTGNSEITIRQIIDKHDLSLLSEARKRIYGKHDEYFKKLYKDDVYLDDMDFRSYIFACYYQGEIIGTQRATVYPFEVNSYLNTSEINQFLGNDYQNNYVEFSRLLVDKDAKVKNLSNMLGFVTGSLIAIATKTENYITYSKPKLKRKSLDFSSDTIQFQINDRNDDIYELYKGSMINDIRRIFSIKGEDTESTLENFKAFIMKTSQHKDEA